MKNKAPGFICAALTVVYMLVIFILSSQNGEGTAAASSWMAEAMAKLFYGSPGQQEIDFVHMIIRKAAHIVLFLGAGVLITLSFAFLMRFKMPLYIVFSCIVTLGAAFFDEWHKLFIYGRHFDVPEVFLNAVSGLVGIALTALIVRKLGKRDMA